MIAHASGGSRAPRGPPRPRRAALTPTRAAPYRRHVALQDFLRLFWFRAPNRLPGPPRPGWRAPARVQVGMRVRLRMPIASPHTTWIPAGAAGIVVGGNPKRRQVSIELDAPRTVVTVPLAWIEEERETPPDAERPA
jgi:hypothetical protein